VGHFHAADSAGFAVFTRAAFSLRGECDFVAYMPCVPLLDAEGVDREAHLGDDDSRVYFVGKASPLSTTRDMQEMRAAVDDEAFVTAWLADKCTPLVQELTFENAEQLTERNVPFLVLFHALDDVPALETYVLEAARQLDDWRGEPSTTPRDECRQDRVPPRGWRQVRARPPLGGRDGRRPPAPRHRQLRAHVPLSQLHHHHVRPPPSRRPTAQASQLAARVCRRPAHEPLASALPRAPSERATRPERARAGRPLRHPYHVV